MSSCGSLFLHRLCDLFIELVEVRNLIGRNHRIAGNGEKICDILVGAVAESTQESRHANLAVPVDSHLHDVRVVYLALDPCTAVRDDGHIDGLAVLAFVDILLKVHAGGPHKLAYNDTLRAVEHERTIVRHLGEIAKENRFLNLDVVVPVGKTNHNSERRRIRGVTLFALLNGIVGLRVNCVLAELQLKFSRAVSNR